MKKKQFMHFFTFLGKKSIFETVLLHQDTLAQVFLTRNKKTNFGPDQNRKENILRPLKKLNFEGKQYGKNVDFASSKNIL
jgi:hypothetical protein